MLANILTQKLPLPTPKPSKPSQDAVKALDKLFHKVTGLNSFKAKEKKNG